MGSTSETVLARFRSCLKSRGLHFSQAREIVVCAVSRMDRHFGAEELAAELGGGPDRVSRGTVYRTLNLLEWFGLIRRVGEVDGPRRYERVSDSPHDHLVCERCGRVIEFTEPALSKAILRVCRERRFQLRAYNLSVVGVCEKCAHK
ncbi:MAG: transcriptional repressor [Candidatus Eisenbacteria bacterium]|nr:transcriptional repressor [Candidatus Eisenbacteria bacterium]